MVVPPVLRCALSGHYEWNGSLSSASVGCGCPWLEAAGDAHSPLRDRERLGFGMRDSLSALRRPPRRALAHGAWAHCPGARLSLRWPQLGEPSIESPSKRILRGNRGAIETVSISVNSTCSQTVYGCPPSQNPESATAGRDFLRGQGPWSAGVSPCTSPGPSCAAQMEARRGSALGGILQTGRSRQLASAVFGACRRPPRPTCRLVVSRSAGHDRRNCEPQPKLERTLNASHSGAPSLEFFTRMHC
jgi:hypothetical protein